MVVCGARRLPLFAQAAGPLGARGSSLWCPGACGKGARRPVPGAYTDVVPGCVREGPVVPGMRGSGAVVVKKWASGRDLN